MLGVSKRPRLRLIMARVRMEIEERGGRFGPEGVRKASSHSLTHSRIYLDFSAPTAAAAQGPRPWPERWSCLRCCTCRFSPPSLVLALGLVFRLSALPGPPPPSARAASSQLVHLARSAPSIMHLSDHIRWIDVVVRVEATGELEAPLT